MPAGIPSSGSCKIRLGSSRSDWVYVECETHTTEAAYVDTPEEAWAWEQAHRRDVAGGGVNVAGALVRPDL